jgi:hypothetical protein
MIQPSAFIRVSAHPAAMHNKDRSVMQTRQACKIHCSVSPVYKHAVFTQDNPGLPVPTKYRARGRLTGRAAAVVRGCGVRAYPDRIFSAGE